MRTAEIRYDKAQETNRYTGTVQARHEVDQAFRVGGKVVARKVDVGQTVREGDVLAMLDDTDYRLAEDAARQQLVAATTAARQAESDRRRNQELIGDGAVSAAPKTSRRKARAQAARAAAEAEARKLELARNRLQYTVLRASRSGVVTAVRAEIGQVVAEGQPVVAIANPGEPEIVVDVPEDQVATFKMARYQASLNATPDQAFDVALRELGAAGGVADAHVPRATEARHPAAAAARCDRDPRRAAPPGGRSGGGDPGRRDHSSEREAGAVWVVRREGGEAGRNRPAAPCRCTGTAATKSSSPGCRPASSSSPRVCRRWRPA